MAPAAVAVLARWDRLRANRTGAQQPLSLDLALHDMARVRRDASCTASTQTASPHAARGSARAAFAPSNAGRRALHCHAQWRHVGCASAAHGPRTGVRQTDHVSGRCLSSFRFLTSWMGERWLRLHQNLQVPMKLEVKRFRIQEANLQKREVVDLIEASANQPQGRSCDMVSLD